MVGAGICKTIVATRSSMLNCFVSNFRFIDTVTVKTLMKEPVYPF